MVEVEELTDNETTTRNDHDDAASGQPVVAQPVPKGEAGNAPHSGAITPHATAANPPERQSAAGDTPAGSANTVAQGVAEGYEVKAPLRGQIRQVAVKPGDVVKQGQVLCTIEALKLENELSSPVAGTVTGVFIQAGANVNTGTVLITIRTE